MEDIKQARRLYRKFLDLWNLADALIEEAHDYSKRCDDPEKKQTLYNQCEQIMDELFEIASQFEEIGFDKKQ